VVLSSREGEVNLDIKQLVNKAVQYIHDSADMNINVADIAARVHLSPSYFATMFRVITGYTVKNYVNRYRLHLAAAKLAAGDNRIIDIAFDAGFHSQESFTRSFAKVYGIPPAKFRTLRPMVEPFPPIKLLKEQQPMEMMECFKNVRFVHKSDFYVVGIEVDIHYNTGEGTAPIGGAWELWAKENINTTIPDRTSENVYGITHGETPDATAKYAIAAEVSTLANLPVGLIGRKFPASEYAVFQTTLKEVLEGGFWHQFHTLWRPASGYGIHEEQFRKDWPTSTLYPNFEVYDSSFKGEDSLIKLYAPVVKR